MTARDEWDATTRDAWHAAEQAARRRHPSFVRESELVLTDNDMQRFHELFTAESQQYPYRNLPPADTPDDHPIPDWVGGLFVVVVVAAFWVAAGIAVWRLL